MGAAPSLEELAKGHKTDQGRDFDQPEQWKLDHVVALRRQFVEGNYDFGMDRDTLDRFLAEGVPAAAGTSGTFWRKLDTNSCGLVNALELMSGLAVMCMSSVEEKIEFLFQLNDFNNQGSLSYDELVVMLYLTAGATVLITGKGVMPEEHAAEAMADECFISNDIDMAQRVELGSFRAWILDYLGISEETPVIGLREFLKKFKSLKHPKQGPTPGSAALAQPASP